jgi:hypothetical protein
MIPQPLDYLPERRLAAEFAVRVSWAQLPEFCYGVIPRTDTPVIEAFFMRGCDADRELHREISSRQD